MLLCALLATAAFLIAVTLSPMRSGYADAADRGPGDVELYRAEVDRIRAGESYYQAAALELRSRGYPTRSIFNWRAPLPMWFAGKLPSPDLAKALLGAAGLALVILAFGFVATEHGVGEALVAVLLLTGAILPCLLGDLFVMPELWSGVLIALSAVCYGSGRWKLGVAAGLAALLLRELAAPYCAVCIVIALRERSRRELYAWSIGLAAYAGYYALHIWHVLPLMGASDLAHPHSWLRFGGAGFVISTVQMNAYLLLLPQWVTALYLTCALLGFATWNTPASRRIGLTGAIYLVAFSFVGHDFNQYWGSMTAPLFCLGAAHGVTSLVEVCRAAWTRSGEQGAMLHA